ncbi:MAG: PHP domain-containing protein [Candidatus Heimdallarchaeota archaeon]|nr:MAG: hypothetical protein DRO91_09920 [Candidatus Heimdallarchaeota archaeon]
MLVDMHIHTNVSYDSKIKVGLLVRKLKELRIAGCAITDHNSLDAIAKAKEIGKKYNIKIFAGVEISTREGHILAYGLTERPPDHRAVAETIEWVHEHGGVTCCAHPFRKYEHSVGDNVYHYHFDAIEINGRSFFSQNRAAELASKLMNVSLIGGSDAHYLQKVGRVTTNFYDEIETEDQLIEAIRKGACEVQYDIQKSYKPELIQAIPKDELNILERFIEIRREPQAAIIESVGKRIRFIDANLQK